MGIEQSMWGTGEEANKQFADFEQQKAERELKKQERFDATKVGDTLSFMDNEGKQKDGWQVKEMHPDTLEVTLHNEGAAFSWDIKVPIDNITSESILK